jgi:hypothetical protein
MMYGMLVSIVEKDEINKYLAGKVPGKIVRVIFIATVMLYVVNAYNPKL